MRIREILNLYDTTNVRIGQVVTENLSNELDSITVVLTNIPKISIESHDIVEFTDENDERSYWLVGNVNKTYMTFVAPFLYEYTIDLISPTKLLELPIPSQTITYRDKPNRDLFEYIKRAFLRYFSLDGRYKGMSVSYSDMPTTLLRAYNNGHAPESTFEKPTLREYLDFLFNFIGYISQLEIVNVQPTQNVANATIAYYQINLKGFNLNLSLDAIDPQYIVEINDNQQAENYITCLEQNMDEVIAPNPVIEKLRFKIEEPIINEENARLYTLYSIYDVKGFYFEASDSDNQYMNVNGVKDYSGGYGIVSGFNIMMGASESNLSYEAFHEILTVTQDEQIVWRWSNNFYDFDSSHKSSGNYKLTKYLKTGNSYVVTSEEYTTNSTAQKISNYKFLIVRNFGNTTSGADDYILLPNVEIDLTKYLFVEEIYETLERIDEANITINSVVKNDCFSWKRGGREINSLLKYETKPGIFNIQLNGEFAMIYAIKFASYNYAVNFFNGLNSLFTSYSYKSSDSGNSSFYYSYHLSTGAPEDHIKIYMQNPTYYEEHTPESYSEVKNWTFSIEYWPYSSFKIKSEKNSYRHKITSMDSNTNVLSDVLSEIKRSKEKVKQLANPNLIMNAISVGTTPAMQIGDYIMLEDGKYTLISLETKHDKTSLLYKGILSKNYSNQVINTIINREKRYYSLPNSSTALIRHEKAEFKITSINNSTGYNIKCNYALIRYEKNAGLVQGWYFIKYCILPITSILSLDNNKVTYTVDLVSNSIYGYTATDTAVTGGNKMKVCKYTDDNAETENLQIMFIYRDENTADDLLYDKSALNDSIENLVNRFESHLPVITLDLEENFFLKDARERLVLSVDLKFDDTLSTSVKTAFNSNYNDSYNKFNITT